MNVFQQKGVTYASAMRPPCGLYPNRNEGVILRKTDEKVTVSEILGAGPHQQHGCNVWLDENEDRHVHMFTNFYRIKNMSTGETLIDWQHTPLVDA